MAKQVKDMELIINESKIVTSVELNDALKNLRDAIVDERKSKKDIAKYIGKIVYQSLYADDFKNVAEFAEYIGLSKSSLTQFKNYYDMTETGFVKSVDLSNYYNSLSYTQIIELYPLYKAVFIDNYGMEENFLDALIFAIDKSTKAIREYVTQTLDIITPLKTENNEKSENETCEEFESETSEEAENKTNNEVEIYINYLKDLEVGIELDNADISIIKYIINILEKLA